MSSVPTDFTVKSSKNRAKSAGCLKIKQAGIWLAGGKDLYWEQTCNRPRTAHVPGWKEGMFDRPKSSAAFRASRYRHNVYL